MLRAPADDWPVIPGGRAGEFVVAAPGGNISVRAARHENAAVATAAAEAA